MRGAEFAISFALQFLRAVHAFEQMGREPSTSDLAEFLKTNFHTIKRYRNILEKEGLIVVEPTDRRNIVRLTDKGRCIARCLIT
ncbi:MAG: hypothetical protein GSR77_00275 [Desulfurococcales archaeon]|nr:hypothetical protein [Desulfurococcales archaeon]